jgi:hypothetical protein
MAREIVAKGLSLLYWHLCSYLTVVELNRRFFRLERHQTGHCGDRSFRPARYNELNEE